MQGQGVVEKRSIIVVAVPKTLKRIIKNHSHPFPRLAKAKIKAKIIGYREIKKIFLKGNRAKNINQ
jgi:hypothetical protein